jgi:hypothetical protein
MALIAFASKSYYNKALTLTTVGIRTHDIEDIKLALQNADKALSINSDDKSAQGLKTSLEQLLAWNHGQG